MTSYLSVPAFDFAHTSREGGGGGGGGGGGVAVTLDWCISFVPVLQYPIPLQGRIQEF